MAGIRELIVEIRQANEQRYLGKRFSAALDAVGPAVAAAYEELFGKLAAARVAPAGPPFLVASTPAGGRLSVEVGVPCSAPPEEGELSVGTLPGGRVAVTVHKGPYDSIGPVYEALSRWIVEHGYTMTGPPREVYLTGLDDAPLDEQVTELVWPIA